ncbi:gamma-glutamyltransferase [Siccirubricoccus deserti]
MYATRPTLYGTRHAVSAGHYLAAAAGFAVLEAGGNAIDAGCAAGIALGVVLPDLVNVAGVAPIIIRKADGTVETIAGLGTWPKSIPADLFMREHGGKIPNGVLRTVVPAAPDAWITALERHGTMGFGDVAQYALRHARDGYAVYPLLAQNIRDHAAEYARWPGNAAIFLPGGRQPQVGENSSNPTSPAPCSTWSMRSGRPRARAPRRPRRGACRLLPRRHRPRDRRFHGARGRLPDHGGPRRLPLEAGAGGAARMARA